MRHWVLLSGLLACLMATGEPKLLAAGGRKLLARVAKAPATAPVEVRANEAIGVKLSLKPGWKLNDGSPTYLALFPKGPVGAPAIAELPLAALKGDGDAVPALKPGEYRLQGKIFYCGTGPASVCHVQGHDQIVRATERATSAAIEVPVGN